MNPTILFLIDGLRYVDHPTATKIRSELGFRSVEASLFTGRPVSDHMNWVDYTFSEGSPFRTMAQLPGIHGLWRLLNPSQRRYFNFFLYRLVSMTGEPIVPRTSLIPPCRLTYSLPAQRQAPDEPQAYGEFPSLFDRLRSKGGTWSYLAPPRISRRGATDERVETCFYAALKEPCRNFYYIKLGDLDRISHRFGPNSPQARHCRARTMRRVAALRSALSQRYGPVNWVMLSDHGFMESPLTITPPTWLEAAAAEGLLRHYFIDSTLLRLWITRPGDRERIVDRVLRWGGAPMMDDKTRSGLGLEWGSPILGDICCVAPHGSVFWPDFFSIAPPAGMHGYLPHPDLESPLDYAGLSSLPSEIDHAAAGRWLIEHLCNA